MRGDRARFALAWPRLPSCPHHALATAELPDLGLRFRRRGGGHGWRRGGCRGSYLSAVAPSRELRQAERAGPRALAWRQMDWMALYAIACALSSAWMLVRTPHVREPGGDSFGDNVLTFLAALQEVLGAMWVIPQLLVFHREKVVYRPFARYVAMATIERVLMLVFHAIRALVKPWERQNVGIQVWCEAANVVMLSRFSIAFLRAGILGDAAFVLEV
mmetsp:Transcript_28718/g.79052  ORF Transcript_28718/g.79052 Transcript_28718/m.79052 type:complete len:217 (+) Transcript_28718:216-866(+)